MSQIKMIDGKLQVPDHPTLPFIAGDGIGKEIWAAARPVFDAAVQKAYSGKRKVDWLPLLAGGAAYRKDHTWLPKATVTALKKYLVGIKGPLTTPIGEGHRSINVTLRQKLDLYACWRPVYYYRGVASPVKHPERVNIDVFRENTEDTYIGIEAPYDSKDAQDLKQLLKKQGQLNKLRFPDTTSFGIKPISKQGTRRIVGAAYDFALRHHKKHVTLVHKGNIMKYTEGSFCRWGYQLAKEYGKRLFTKPEYEHLKATAGAKKANEALAKAKSDQNVVLVNDVIADNFFQQVLLRPERFDVVVTMNLNGDYISDDIAAEVGGIGIAPSSNINYQTGRALFEATHGTAPDIAGKGLANPTSILLSGSMMFSFLGWRKAAKLINQTIRKSIVDQYVTKDLATSKASHVLSTQEYSQHLVDTLK